VDLGFTTFKCVKPYKANCFKKLIIAFQQQFFAILQFHLSNNITSLLDYFPWKNSMFACEHKLKHIY